MRNQKKWQKDLGFPEKADVFLKALEKFLKSPKRKKSIAIAEKLVKK